MTSKDGITFESDEPQSRRPYCDKCNQELSIPKPHTIPNNVVMCPRYKCYICNRTSRFSLNWRDGKKWLDDCKELSEKENNSWLCSQSKY